MVTVNCLLNLSASPQVNTFLYKLPWLWCLSAAIKRWLRHNLALAWKAPCGVILLFIPVFPVLGLPVQSLCHPRLHSYQALSHHNSCYHYLYWLMPLLSLNSKRAEDMNVYFIAPRSVSGLGDWAHLRGDSHVNVLNNEMDFSIWTLSAVCSHKQVPCEGACIYGMKWLLGKQMPRDESWVKFCFISFSASLGVTVHTPRVGQSLFLQPRNAEAWCLS